jgi:hypothetical protein
MTGFGHLQNVYRELDERPYNHRVRIGSVAQGSLDAQHRFTFYPDNKLRWANNKTSRADDGRTEYGFPDEATARKFAERFGGEYVGIDGA